MRYGDVRALEFQDGYFDGCFSLGVIEHVWEGYDAIIKEMYRTLKQYGYAFLSFPCISPLDNIKIMLSGYEIFSGSEKPHNFYQFALDIQEVKKDCESIGFRCISNQRQYGLSGMQRVIPAFKPVSEWLWAASRKSIITKTFTVAISCILQPLCGLSAMLVLKKQ